MRLQSSTECDVKIPLRRPSSQTQRPTNRSQERTCDHSSETKPGLFMSLIMESCGLKSPKRLILTRGSKTFASSVKSPRLSSLVDATVNTMKRCTKQKNNTGHRGSMTFLVTDQSGAKTMRIHRYCGRKVMTLKAVLTIGTVGAVFAKSIPASIASGKARCASLWLLVWPLDGQGCKATAAVRVPVANGESGPPVNPR